MKSDIVRRRNTSMIIFQLLKAIDKTEDSTEENQKKDNKPYYTILSHTVLRNGPSHLPSPNDIYKLV